MEVIEESEREQTLRFLSQASFPGLKSVLERYANSLAPKQDAVPPAPAAVTPPVPPAAKPAAAPVTSSLLLGQKQYIPVEDFSWDQGDYNSSTVTVYVDLPGVGTVKDSVTCDFGVSSFDLKVITLSLNILDL